MTTKHVNWREVDSSNVNQVGWDDEGNMYVRYGDRLYKYAGVSRQRVVAVSRTTSVGSYIARKIKPNYVCTRLV